MSEGIRSGVRRASVVPCAATTSDYPSQGTSYEYTYGPIVLNQHNKSDAILIITVNVSQFTLFLYSLSLLEKYLIYAIDHQPIEIYASKLLVYSHVVTYHLLQRNTL